MARSILVSGASSGIGEHCARRLREDGWRVFAGARNDDDLARLAAIGVESVRLDLDDSKSIAEAADWALRKTDGKLDALFNNAGFGQPGAVEDLPRAALREQFETNVFGAVELANRILPAMRARGRGRIVQNSSVLGFVALPLRGAYCASKFALEALTDTMRIENGKCGIDFVLIEPGPIESNFRQAARARFERHFSAAKIAASAHRAAYEKMLADDGAPRPFTLSAAAVYRALARALSAPRPRRRYFVTTPTRVFWHLRRFAPTAALDYLLAKSG